MTFIAASLHTPLIAGHHGNVLQKRMISVREPDGTLRTANWDERGRINQIFLPVDGRSVAMPKMFEEPHLTVCYMYCIIYI